MPRWPEWWSWELELSPHLLKRMLDRQFSEADLRMMIEDATDYYLNHVEGRWVVQTKHADREWEVVVEPLSDERILLVITAYPIE
jgi:hypothetical protein